MRCLSLKNSSQYDRDPGQCIQEDARLNLTSLLLALLLPALARTQTNPGTEPLKLLVSVEQESITAPFPLRLTLHLHNSGQVPIWLYRHVQDPDTLRQMAAMPMNEDEERKANRTSGGSTLVVRLEPVAGPSAQPAAQTVVTAGARVLTSVGLPRPSLVKLRPGEDYDEKAIIKISPAQARADSRDEAL